MSDELCDEVKAATEWIVALVKIRSDYVHNPATSARDRRQAASPFAISEERMRLFEWALAQTLYDSFKPGWSTDNPADHQAYRTIHVSPQFPVNQFIKRAADKARIPYNWLGISDMTFTVWTDPCRVTARYNDHDAMNIIFTKSSF